MNKITILFLYSTMLYSSLLCWKNWSKKDVCYPEHVISVSCLEEIQFYIKQALQTKQTIRAVGSGHSWGPILCSEGYLLETKELNKILFLDVKNKIIKVQAGITLKKLIHALAEHTLTLPNIPSITKQTIAGALATGTHGSGKTGTLANFVVNMELVAADGTLYTLSSTENAHFFNAALVNIGSLGIIYSVTLSCVPLYKLKHEQWHTTFDFIKKNYKKLYDNHDFFTFMYNVHQDSVAVDVWDITDEATSESSLSFHLQRLIISVYNWLVVHVINQFLPDTKKIAPLSIPTSSVAYSYKALAGEPSPYYLEEEVAVPVSKLPEALEALKNLIAHYNKKGIAINGIICRFVLADTHALLSPSAGQDVVFLNVSMPQTQESEFYKDFYKLMLTFDGRPHWGKINYITKQDASRLYGKNFDLFLQARKRLDPAGIFSNAFTKTVFGW
ncbi:MAG: D-arabinono-1,4-lactone oxidase [Candidatus Babeliales bacterium]